MDVDNLPPSLQNIVRGYLDGKKGPKKRGSNLPKGGADHLNYKITISEGKKASVIECNELGIDSGMKSLVSYIQKNSKKK